MDLSNLAELIRRFSRSGVPKYLAFRDAFVYALNSGDIRAGEKLPGEKELAESLPLSLGTIQKALRLLSDERVITRKTGQGSFVTPNNAEEMSAPFHCRFINDEKTGYVPAYPRIVSRSKAETSGEWAEHLKTKTIVCIERVININHEFNVYTKFYVDSKRLPVFETSTIEKLGTQNFKDVIFVETGKTIGKMDLFVSLVSISSKIAYLLEIPKNTPVMRFTAYAYLGETDPIYYQEIVFPKTDRPLHISVDGTNRGLNL